MIEFTPSKDVRVDCRVGGLLNRRVHVRGLGLGNLLQTQKHLRPVGGANVQVHSLRRDADREDRITIGWTRFIAHFTVRTVRHTSSDSRISVTIASMFFPSRMARAAIG